jgi:hypothetical protein
MRSQHLPWSLRAVGGDQASSEVNRTLSDTKPVSCLTTEVGATLCSDSCWKLPDAKWFSSHNRQFYDLALRSFTVSSHSTENGVELPQSRTSLTISNASKAARPRSSAAITTFSRCKTAAFAIRRTRNILIATPASRIENDRRRCDAINRNTRSGFAQHSAGSERLPESSYAQSGSATGPHLYAASSNSRN